MTSLVTTHAVYRWLTRVKGIARADMIALTDPLASDRQLVRAGCEILGLTVVSAEREMLSPRGRIALALGATTIRCDGYSLMIEDGRVLTCVTGQPRRKNKSWTNRNVDGRVYKRRPRHQRREAAE